MSIAIIDVTFIDVSTGTTFLQLKLPSRQLPETFAPGTVMNLGKDDWNVVEATPPTAAEFIAGGKLVLRLEKLRRIDPREILFSLPTVADEVPKSVPGSSGSTALLSLHEDDWMQLELVPAELAARAQPELDAIKDVLANARKGPGFERLHIRKALPAPFAERALLLDGLGAASPIAWRGQSGILDGGFAIPVEGGVLYGKAAGPRIAQLGVDRREADPKELRAREKLVLIDWVKAEVIS